jgi:hypothetical protein
VCWIFGRTVSQALSEAGMTRADGGPIPLGLISNNWGGTRVEQWMPADAIEPCSPAGAATARHGAYRQAPSRSGADGSLDGGGVADGWAGDDAGTVGGGWRGAQWGNLSLGASGDSNLYNAMILPYAEGPMELSGAIWYQVRDSLPPRPLFGYEQLQRQIIRSFCFRLLGLTRRLPQPRASFLFSGSSTK